MRKPVLFSLFIILLSVTVIANLFPNQVLVEKTSAPDPIQVRQDANPDDVGVALQSTAPSPEKLLLIGLGMICLIVHRRIYLHQKS